MFHILNKNLRVQVFLLTVLLAWSAFTIFTTMTPCAADGKQLLFQLLVKWFAKSTLTLRIVSLLLVTISTLGIIRHFNKQKFEDTKTLMPGIFFLLITNCSHLLDTFNPSFFTILTLSTVMMIFTPGAAPAKMKNNTLTFGLMIATATLVDFSAFGIVLFLMFIIATNSVSPKKDNLILLSGLILPYITAFSVFYICNSTNVFVKSWQQLEFFSPLRTFTSLNVLDYVSLSFYFLALIVFWLRGRNYFENKLIMLRQAYTGLHLQFISMTLFMILGSIGLMPALAYLTPSASEYMSISIIKKRYRFVYDAIIITMCVLLWL